MANENEAESRRRFGVKGILTVLIVVLAVALSAWGLATVSKTSQIPPSSFVTLPTTPLSKNGTSVTFDSISAIGEKGVAVGEKGYLRTSSGQPVAGAQVYAQYYLQGEYRTQVATTDQNGYFEMYFPMNWTGWLTVTTIYFGDNQHQGLRIVSSVSGENL